MKLGGAFFRAIPSRPGVYFFFGQDDTLLYIGQSVDLRSRVGSYRHVTPEKNPKRTLRLVARTTRIEWELCDSASAAIERERVLLLERRPPFNRAGVWKGDPWWLAMTCEGAALRLRLTHEAEESSFGPFPASARYALASMLRVVLRVTHPHLPISAFPFGSMNTALPRDFLVPLPDVAAALRMMASGARGNMRELLDAHAALPPPGTMSEQEFWQEEIDRLAKYGAKMICDASPT